jgi:hypothetical protein
MNLNPFEHSQEVRADRIAPNWTSSIETGVLVFCFSRLFLFLIWACVACVETDSGDTHRIGAPFINLNAATISKDLEHMAVYNDAGGYYGIAQGGYEVRPFDTSKVANWGHFPLHPMIWRALVPILGDSPLVGVGLANLYFLFALILLHRLCGNLGYVTRVADGAVWALAFFPTSYFFSMPWSESLFLLVSVACTYAALTRHWFAAALLGAAACACRLAGLFLVFALAIWMWQHRRELPRRSWLAVCFMPIGLIVFMWMLRETTGNALAFVDLQSVWGRHFELPVRALGVVLAKPLVVASDANLRHWNFLIFFWGCAAAYWLAFRRGQLWLATFLVLCLCVPALTGTIASISRYAMGSFPLAIAMGYSLQNPKIERPWLIVSSALLALMAVAFQARLSFAGI